MDRTSQVGLIYRDNQRFVERVVFRLLRSDWREDAVQETWLRVLSSPILPSLDENNIRPWLYVLAKCEVAKTLKAHYRFHPRESKSKQPVAASHEESIIRADALKRLRKLMSRLPASQREAIEGRLLGRSVAQMAKASGINQGAMWERVNRGYRSLRGYA